MRRPRTPTPTRALQLDDDRFALVEQTLIDQAIGHRVMLRVRRRNTNNREYELRWMGEADLCECCAERLLATSGTHETWWVYDEPPSDRAIQYVLDHELGRPTPKETGSTDRTLTLNFAVVSDADLKSLNAQFPAPAAPVLEEDEPEEPETPAFGLADLGL